MCQFSPPTSRPATTAVTVTCGYASDNGEAPNLSDSHNVWNNAATDGSFGVSSSIILFDLSTEGQLLGALQVPCRAGLHERYQDRRCEKQGELAFLRYEHRLAYSSFLRHW